MKKNYQTYLEDARKYADLGNAPTMEDCIDLAIRYSGCIGVNISNEVTNIRNLL